MKKIELPEEIINAIGPKLLAQINERINSVIYTEILLQSDVQVENLICGPFGYPQYSPRSLEVFNGVAKVQHHGAVMCTKGESDLDKIFALKTVQQELNTLKKAIGTIKEHLK